MTDKEFDKCMKKIASGDRDALKDIYTEYLKLIYSVIYDTIKHREEAEDLTSDFFVKLYTIAPTFVPGQGHKRWLVTIAKNMTIDRIKKLDREMMVDEMPEPQIPHESLENTIIQNVDLQTAMKSLTDEEREVLDLKVVGGFTFKEISEMKRKPQGTVSWIYNNAIKKLRRCAEWVLIIMLMISKIWK